MSSAKIDPKSMKVNELKAELSKRGLDTSGLKNDLVMRLQQALDDEEFGLDGDGTFVEPTIEEKSTEEIPEVQPSPVRTAAPLKVASPPAAQLSSTSPAPVISSSEPTTKSTSIVRPETEAGEVIVAVDSSVSKLQERAARFGVVSTTAKKVIDDEKKAVEAKLVQEKLNQRAERFGIAPKSVKPVPDDAKKVVSSKRGREQDPEDFAKIQKRTERFGAISEKARQEESKKQKEAEEEKLRQRSQRFQKSTGIVGSVVEKPVDPELAAKLAARAQRFGKA